MAAPQTPYGLDQWLAFLRDKPLPARAPVLAKLRSLLQNPELSLMDLPALIRLDPVLCLHLVGHANQLNSNPETDIGTIELAVSTLGLNRIQTLAEGLPALKLNPASAAHRQYNHAINHSYHAATQASALCRFSNQAQINECRMAALFYGVGHWAMWRYAPVQVSAIKEKIIDQQIDVVLAEHDLLGCTLQEISQGLVREWHLSRLAEQALEHGTSPDAEMLDRLHRRALGHTGFSEEEHRELKYLLNAAFLPVKLANWLALTVPYGWHRPKAQRLIEIISDFLRQPVDEVSPQLRARCAQASREYRVPGVMPPGAELLLLPSSKVLPYKLRAQNAVAPEQAVEKAGEKSQEASQTSPPATSSSPNDYQDRELFMAMAKRLTDSNEQMTPGAILDALTKGLTAGLGLERLSLYMVEEGSQIRGLRSFGFEAKDPLARFTHSLRIPSLFKQMTGRPQAVWIGPYNRNEMWPLLPERFKAICHPKSFLLLSLFHQARPLALVYADLHDENRHLNEFHFKQFRALGRAANASLNRGAVKES